MTLAAAVAKIQGEGNCPQQIGEGERATRFLSAISRAGRPHHHSERLIVGVSILLALQYQLGRLDVSTIVSSPQRIASPPQKNAMSFAMVFAPLRLYVNPLLMLPTD